MDFLSLRPFLRISQAFQNEEVKRDKWRNIREVTLSVKILNDEQVWYHFIFFHGVLAVQTSLSQFLALNEFKSRKFLISSFKILKEYFAVI